MVKTKSNALYGRRSDVASASPGRSHGVEGRLSVLSSEGDHWQRFVGIKPRTEEEIVVGGAHSE